MRKVLFWVHLCAGITAGVVILVMSVTGVLLTYERQLTAWADGYRVPPPGPGTPRLGAEALTARVREAKGAWPSAITVYASATAPAEFGFGREATVFVDPYTGVILGEGATRARAFFRAVTDWHRWLALSGERRTAGRAVTGAANLVFLFIVLSGLYLWWPRSFTARRLRPLTLPVAGLRGKARDFNWHNAFGFWAALPLVLVVTSGVVISYPWANDLVYRLAGSAPPPRRGGPPGPGGPMGTPPPGAPRGQQGPGAPRGEAPRAEVSLTGLDRVWPRAETQVPAWQSLSLWLPAGPDAPWVFTADVWTGARRPDTRTQFTVDRASDATTQVEAYASAPAGRSAFVWLRFIHTGEAFGVVGQTVAGLASAFAVVLVWTGTALSLRRFTAWRRRQAQTPGV